MAKSSTKKRKVIVESTGEADITASFNNIIISLTNKKGDVISWSSAGKMGFRGSKKNTPYAAQLAAEDCAATAHAEGLRKVKVYVKGPGNGRESAIRSIHNSGIEVTEIIDHGDLHGNPIPVVSKKEEVVKGPDPELSLTDEEEELLKQKLEAIRKSDPFIYR